MTWQRALVAAAKARARVELDDGLTGTLVYAPSQAILDGAPPAERAKPPRHGDRRLCGVRPDGSVRTIGVPATSIVRVFP